MIDIGFQRIIRIPARMVVMLSMSALRALSHCCVNTSLSGTLFF